MPRSFDQNQINIDRNPLVNFVDLPTLPTLNPEDIFAGMLNGCTNSFVTGLAALGTGSNQLVKIDTGLQSFIDTIFGLLLCNLQGNLTPQIMLEQLGNLLNPIINNGFVQGLVEFAEFLGRETGTFIGDIFAGATGLADWFCGILTCNPEAVGTTPQTIIDGVQAVLDPIIANPFIQGIIAWAEDVGVAVGNFALDLYNGILAMVEALCSLITTGALPTTYGNWSNTPMQIITDLTAVVTTLLNNPIIDGLRDLIAGTGNVLYDTITGLSQFVTDLVGLLGEVMTGPAAIIDFFSTIFGEDGFLGWLTSLPFIGPLVSKLTGLDSSGDIALDLASLGNWASGLLTTTSNIPANKLFGSLPEAVFATIPVSSINFTAGNLLSQGNFNNAQTVDPAGGWTWDADTTATGTGGSLKATATGSLQQMYSRQTIKIAAGDRVDVSAVVKTSGFTSGSIVLSVVPWIGTVAQPVQVISTRTTSAATFPAGSMTGSRLRFGGTAEAGEILMSGSITALTVRLAVTANTGAQVWFDDVKVVKAGALAQTLVEYLTTTWEQAWNAVFGSGGVGKIWSDFVTAISTVNIDAGVGKTGATTNAGNITGIIDSIGQAIFGDSAYAALPQTTKQSIRKLVGTLFGVNNAVLDEITGEVLPPIDATTLTGDVPIGNIPTDQLLPGVGSGALLTRKSTANVNANIGRTKFPSGFYTHLDRASTDISAMTTGGVPGTGIRNDYSGIFRVANAGWYLCEISVRLNASFSFDWKIATVLYKGTNLTNPTVYKVGTDSQVGCRYAQSSFIVYLEANETVQAGFDGAGYAIDLFDADETGAETYFSISLLNKTFPT